MKALFRFYILAGKEGLSQPDAARKAQAQVEQHAEQIAQLEAEQTRMLAARDAEERQRGRSPLPPRALASGGKGSRVGGAPASSEQSANPPTPARTADAMLTDPPRRFAGEGKQAHACACCEDARRTR